MLQFKKFLFLISLIFKLNCAIQEQSSEASLMFDILHDADQGDVTALKNKLEEGADPNCVSNKMPLLVQAVKIEKIELVRIILETKDGCLKKLKSDFEKEFDMPLVLIQIIGDYIWPTADINIKVKGTENPLRRAVASDYTELAKFLINKKADINAKNINGCTALHFATQHQNIELACLLIEKKADIEARDIHGLYPLKSSSINFDRKPEFDLRVQEAIFRRA